ncbi:unnamed protein product [Rangifer tarandus platyrhynchus]|uniref:Uncharacterized protein n=2 Tax=Rangifer tarandus platyrhynchus TaxID=3082113 RepID=A0ABN8ZDL7_RANTA|nr:unnamed protein product [Rangifer tarandus platyrhynchus]CAI9707706.1 unnamed protein product [Rangifer tarandus platyrhynchus]
MLRDGIEAKPLDVFLSSRPLSCSRHRFPSGPAEPLGCGISVPASPTRLPSSLGGPVPPAPRVWRVSRVACSAASPRLACWPGPVLPGCTQRAAELGLQARPLS